MGGGVRKSGRVEGRASESWGGVRKGGGVTGLYTVAVYGVGRNINGKEKSRRSIQDRLMSLDWNDYPVGVKERGMSDDAVMQCLIDYQALNTERFFQNLLVKNGLPFASLSFLIETCLP